MLARRNICARAADQGAAAVEFALVVPILVFLLFGIIDYGLYFTNSLSVRAGASEGARQASVGNFSSTCNGPFAATGSTNDLIEKVESCASAVAGSADAKVTYPDGWVAGKNVIVCAAIKVDGVTGITPMPRDGIVTARVPIPIQQGPPAVPAPAAPTLPNPSNPTWFAGWC